jgi:hypothetical protein
MGEAFPPALLHSNNNGRSFPSCPFALKQQWAKLSLLPFCTQTTMGEAFPPALLHSCIFNPQCTPQNLGEIQVRHPLSQQTGFQSQSLYINTLKQIRASPRIPPQKNRYVVNSAGIRVPGAKCHVSTSLLAGPLTGVPLGAVASVTCYLRTLALQPPTSSASVPYKVASGEKSLCEVEREANSAATITPKRPTAVNKPLSLPPPPVPFRSTAAPAPSAQHTPSTEERASLRASLNNRLEKQQQHSSSGPNAATPSASASSERGKRARSSASPEHDGGEGGQGGVPRPKKAARACPSLSWEVKGLNHKP